MEARYRQQFIELYESAFPVEERRPTMLELQMDNELFHNDIILHDESFAGFITWWNFDSCCYIEHFAILPQLRSKGLGAQTLDTLAKQACKPLVAEVELPETEQARRRLAFYERCRFHAFGQTYVQPAYSAESSPIPLLLLTTDIDLSDERFELIRHTLYKHVYRAE